MHDNAREETTVEADATTIWRVWSDFDRFTEWDPREEEFEARRPVHGRNAGLEQEEGLHG